MKKKTDFEIVYGYDETDPISIESFGQRLIGKTFQDVCDEDDMLQLNVVRETSNYEASHENKKRKGGLGNLIEERHFHYEANNDARPDFPKAGVELKVSCYKVNKKGGIMAKERVPLTMIDYFSVVNESFETSHMWNKSKLILFIYYLYQQEIKNRLDYRINYVKLFTPPEEDIKIIKHDFDVIADKIRAGKAHELSEGDTLYLGAATKAADSSDRRKQPFSDEPAKPRAFSFKNSYMTYVLNNYIIPGKSTYESIVKGAAVDSFEDYVVEKINNYSGYTVRQICEEFGLAFEEKMPKNLGAMLAYRILGIRGNKAEEFEKANIAIKTIRIGRNKKIKEHMSFPTFKFKELINEEWEDSTFGNYLRDTRFLFVVYKYDENNELRLKGCQFWNMPYKDLEKTVRLVWLVNRNIIRDGMQFFKHNGKFHNNLTKASDELICHVRPHGKNALDMDELPDGRHYPKQCFWLNNSYILSQLNPEFLED